MINAMVSPFLICSDTEREAAVRRAIISIAPDYFAWADEAQERYRATLSQEHLFRVRQALLKSLFGIEAATSQELEEALDSFSNVLYLLLNSAMLSITGIGDDGFFLNEGMSDGASLLDFETLRDYDHADHCFQESVRQQDVPGAIARPYRGTPYWRWARLRIGGVFHYANICLLAGYVNSKLEEFGFDKIDLLIPHQYVEGKDHGKREGKGTLFDMRIEAGGLEGQLEELKDRSRLSVLTLRSAPGRP